MRTNQAIIVAGALIAFSTGGAILLVNRYEVAQPFNPILFTRLDRWTGQVETCGSIYDNKTYCGRDLVRRNQQAIDADHLAANERFLALGYTQHEINLWPASIIEQARNLVGNGGSDTRLVEFLNSKGVTSTK